MEDMLVRQNRMSCNSVEERLQHPFPTGNHGSVFFRLGLFDCIFTYGLFQGYRRDDERRVQLDKAITK